MEDDEQHISRMTLTRKGIQRDNTKSKRALFELWTQDHGRTSEGPPRTSTPMPTSTGLADRIQSLSASNRRHSLAPDALIRRVSTSNLSYYSLSDAKDDSNKGKSEGQNVPVRKSRIRIPLQTRGSVPLEPTKKPLESPPNPLKKERPVGEHEKLWESLGKILDPTHLPAFHVEVGEENARERNLALTMKLTVPEDVYAKYFYVSKHLNYIVVIGEEKFIISVLPTPMDRKYKALKTTNKGYEDIFIDQAKVLADKRDTDPLSKKILKYLSQLYKDGTVYRVKTEYFPEDLVQIERKHPQDNQRRMKIAVVQSKGEQVLPSEMFTNEGSPEMETFLNTIGQKVDLTTWNGYRGDMGRHGQSYHTSWNGFEVMYHVTTMMDPEMHRRLIGNDLAVIFFHESNVPFNPSKIDQLGTVPQIFAVVQPCQHNGTTMYRLGFFNRVNVKPYFGPQLPYRYIFDAHTLKDFLLTKLSNGYMTALASPPMNRLFYVPRTASIAALVEKYPPQREKNAKTREKHDVANRTLLRKQMRKELVVRVISGRGLIPKSSSGFSDPFCVVTLKDQHFKTEVIKKSLNPMWDQRFTFDIVGLNEVTTDFVLTCHDQSLIGSKEFMGEIILPLSHIRQYYAKINNVTNTDQKARMNWFKLHSKNNKQASGDILLEFELLHHIKEDLKKSV
eukprot:TRINITY_DN6390_c0_g1_i1.p1 TRINITY_DN6390_c0_g1~~TRINITY_DN6390_c0_g1_i1.p1  ORF type:complete len:675 (-),score=165.25 TRINITY_DN6390_c0_g1_i1:156-2180(-)